MKRSKNTYHLHIFRLLNVVVLFALMFFLVQGNSMYVTDLFADKFVDLVDSDTPPPSEERSDSGKTNNISEEDHLHQTLFEFIAFNEVEVNFQFHSVDLCASVLMNVTTPPPEYS